MYMIDREWCYCFSLFISIKSPKTCIQKNSLVIKIKEATVNLPSTVFLWAPGHVGISGNEEADMLSKE